MNSSKMITCAALLAALSAQAREVNFAPARYEGDAALSCQPLRFAYYPTANSIRVSHGTDEEVGRCGTFRIKDAKGKVLFERQVHDEKEWTAKVPDLKAATLKSGDGSYTAEFTNADGKVDVIPFRRDVFDWEGNQLGLSDTVPPPFKPIGIGTHKWGFPQVKTVMNTFTLDNLGLIKQVEAAGKEIMPHPTRFFYIKDGEVTSVSGAAKPFVFTKVGKLSAKGFSTFDTPGLKGRVDVEWWCDGMLDWRLTIDYADVDRLHLVLPLKGEEAGLYHAVTDFLRINDGGKLKDGEGIIWNSGMAKKLGMAGDYVPYLWVGGPERGLAVFGDNDRGWITGGWTCQDIQRLADGVIEIWNNIFQLPTRFTTPRTIRMGFQATPIKPMHPQWRNPRRVTLLGSCWAWGGQTACNDLGPSDDSDEFLLKMAEERKTGTWSEAYLDGFMKKYRYSPMLTEEEGKRRLRNIRDERSIGLRESAGMKDDKSYDLAFYMNARGLNFNLPAGRTFCDEWYRLKFVNRLAFDVDAGTAYEMDPVPSYLDYAASRWKRLLDSGACDVFYFDDVFTAANFCPETSAAFMGTEGAMHAASGIFNMRQLVLRAAVLMTEMGRNPIFNTIHMTNTALAPVCAFAGVNEDWEDNGMGNYLQERYSREYIQAVSTGRQFGSRCEVTGFIENVTPEEAQEKEECGLGVVLTHETTWLHRPVWDKIHTQLCEWGYGAPTTKVWNYWYPDEFPVEITGLDSTSLAMKRADGESIVIVSSWENRAKLAKVKPKADLVKRSFTATDFRTGDKLSIVGGEIQVPLKAYRWCSIRIKEVKK